MQKIIKETRNITIDQLQHKLDHGAGLNEFIVFYYSGNERYPVFLIHNPGNGDENWGFQRPMMKKKLTYAARTMREAIENAQKSRDVFVLHYTQWDELFKKRPTYTQTKIKFENDEN